MHLFHSENVLLTFLLQLSDELSLSLLDCLLPDSKVFILFAEINQILPSQNFFYSHFLNSHVSGSTLSKN